MVEVTASRDSQPEGFEVVRTDDSLDRLGLNRRRWIVRVGHGEQIDLSSGHERKRIPERDVGDAGQRLHARLQGFQHRCVSFPVGARR